MNAHSIAITIGMGGAAGAVCRFHLNDLIMSGLMINFPVGILCINVLGALLMGLLQGGMKRTGKAFPLGYGFLGTGFLGGFTTFSTFSLDTLNLYHTGSIAAVILNIVLNTTLCIGAVWGGYRLIYRKSLA